MRAMDENFRNAETDLARRRSALNEALPKMREEFLLGKAPLSDLLSLLRQRRTLADLAGELPLLARTTEIPRARMETHRRYVGSANHTLRRHGFDD